jgi:hypothetical protein
MNRQLLEQPFEPSQIKQREGNFGKMLDYIEGHAVIQRLNDAFESQWSFSIIRHEILKDTDEVIVLGELKAGEIVKTQFGSSQITRARETKQIISLADDLKAAATDALKKAATLLGVGLHLYNGNKNASPSGTGNGRQNGGNQKQGHGNGNGNGNGTANGNGNGNGNGRLSDAQFRYILRLGYERGLTRSEINGKCQQAFGVVLDHLSKSDASTIIQMLQAN